MTLPPQRASDGFSVPLQPRSQSKTLQTRPVRNDELDFMGEGFAPPIPPEVEESCNETLEKITRSVKRAATYVELESGLDQVPERDDLSSDADGQAPGAKSKNKPFAKTTGQDSFFKFGRSAPSEKSKSISPKKAFRESFQE